MCGAISRAAISRASAPISPLIVGRFELRVSATAGTVTVPR